ncbi:MAG: DUF357 domain-containing protein [Candidatus Aenigmarchaeota archaeon]|nr:DUF357 domain-containing protein [Candidatus Aenigmarchaeota archaeon]MDI6722970.1 DUF357 domain-containing protein [Candidatus Aenigmarchaeota archaeon]
MENLKEEIEKWATRAKEKRKRIFVEKGRENLLVNIDAYISDSEHFLRKNDLIRSFESIIWAWAWIEILQELRIVKE